jgi:O-antigen/teichoic acid export membrane protein
MNVSLLCNIAGAVLAGTAVYLIPWYAIESVAVAFLSGLIVGLSSRYSVSVESNESEYTSEDD